MPVSEIRDNTAVNLPVASPSPDLDSKASVMGSDGNGRSVVWEKAAVFLAKMSAAADKVCVVAEPVLRPVGRIIDSIIKKFAAAGKIIGAALGVVGAGVAFVATLGFAPKVIDRLVKGGEDHSPSSKGYLAACKAYFAGSAMIGGRFGEGLGERLGQFACTPVAIAGVAVTGLALPVLLAVDYARSTEQKGNEAVAGNAQPAVLA